MFDFTPAWISALEGFEKPLPMRESKEGAVLPSQPRAGFSLEGRTSQGPVGLQQKPLHQIGSLVQQAKRGPKGIVAVNSLGRPAPEYHPLYQHSGESAPRLPRPNETNVYVYI